MPSAISVLFCNRPNAGIETGAPDPRAASRVRPIRLRHLGRGLPPQELKRIDAEIDRLRQDRAQQHGQRKNIILQLGLRSAITRALCADERLLTLIEGVVHPGIAIYSAKMVEKPALDETVCHWHQDDAYSQQQSISACRMSVWIPLSDCDEGNGCLWVVPGSHLQGLQPWSRREDGFCNLAF